MTQGKWASVSESLAHVQQRSHPGVLLSFWQMFQSNIENQAGRIKTRTNDNFGYILLFISKPLS